MQIKTVMRDHLPPVRMTIIYTGNKSLARMWRKGNSCAPLARMGIGIATAENGASSVAQRWRLRLPRQEPRRCGFSPWVEKISWSGKWHPFQYSCVGESLDQRSLSGYSDRIAELDATVWACTVTSYMCRVLCFSSRDIKITFLQAEIWLWRYLSLERQKCLEIERLRQQDRNEWDWSVSSSLWFFCPQPQEESGRI